MIKITILAIFAVSVLLTGTIAGTTVLLQPAEALKGQGVSTSQYGKETKDIVCGDRLCSEVEQEQKPKEEKKKNEQVKQEKKAESSDKAKEAPKKDAKSETMEQAKKTATLKSPKTMTGIMTSTQDPGQGHEAHQLAIILPMSENTYRGHLTYTSSENVQLVALHGPLKAGMAKGQPIWTVDGKTKYGLTLVDKNTSSGVWQFSGNAIAVHTTNSEPFTVSYSVTYTEHEKQSENVIRGTMTSKPDAGIGHEDSQTIMLLGPRDKPFRGHLTYDSSEPVIIMTLIGPMSKSQLAGMPTWTSDGETFYALVTVSTKAAGSTAFSGNALALQSQNSEPFTASYSIVLTK